MAAEATLISRVDKLTVSSLVGMSVGDARAKFRTILNISENAYPTLNGAPVEADYVIRANDVINFQVALGEKGA